MSKSDVHTLIVPDDGKRTVLAADFRPGMYFLGMDIVHWLSACGFTEAADIMRGAITNPLPSPDSTCGTCGHELAEHTAKEAGRCQWNFEGAVPCRCPEFKEDQ